jgi:hypothetical protein
MFSERSSFLSCLREVRPYMFFMWLTLRSKIYKLMKTSTNNIFLSYIPFIVMTVSYSNLVSWLISRFRGSVFGFLNS